MDETRFYYSTDGTDSLGPVPPSALRDLYERGTITIDSFLCREGESTWVPFDPASLPPLEPEPATVPLKTLKVPTQALPGTKPLTRGLIKPEAKPKAELKPKQEPRLESAAVSRPEAKPVVELKPKPKPQAEPAPVFDLDETAGDEFETGRFKIVAWGICGFVSFDTALFLTWQRPPGTTHSTFSTVLFFVGELFFVLVIPFLIAFAVPRLWRYRAQTGLTLLLALTFVGLRFVLPTGKSEVASTSTPSTNAASLTLPTAPPATNAPSTAMDTNSSSTNAPAAAVETSSDSTNAATVVIPPAPETNTAPQVAPAVTAPATNAAPAVTSVPADTNAAPVVSTPTPPPAPPPVPAVDPAAVARDVQKVNDALAEKVKASAAAEAACPNFNPATITTHENVAQRQAAITAWQTMQNEVLTYLQGYDDHVRDALAHENLNQKDLDDAVADARKKAQVDQLVALWQLKIKLSSDHLARLLYLDKVWDHWSGKTGKLVFDNQAVLDDYTKFLTALQEDVKGIADIQKQLTP